MFIGATVPLCWKNPTPTAYKHAVSTSHDQPLLVKDLRAGAQRLRQILDIGDVLHPEQPFLEAAEELFDTADPSGWRTKSGTVPGDCPRPVHGRWRTLFPPRK